MRALSTGPALGWTSGTVTSRERQHETGQNRPGTPLTIHIVPHRVVPPLPRPRSPHERPRIVHARVDVQRPRDRPERRLELRRPLADRVVHDVERPRALALRVEAPLARRVDAQRVALCEVLLAHPEHAVALEPRGDVRGVGARARRLAVEAAQAPVGARLQEVARIDAPPGVVDRPVVVEYEPRCRFAVYFGCD